uniref:J domain-containing protein n=1 Tax=Panagrolaimus superbus TaxID=310955 RepID=A0A914YL88_9BILA
MVPSDENKVLSFVDKNRHWIAALFASDSALWIEISDIAKQAVYKFFADLIQNLKTIHIVANAEKEMLQRMSMLAKAGKLWNNEISGERAAQNISDAFIILGSSVVGATALVTVGNVLGYLNPLGWAAAGAALGGFGGIWLTHLTQIFDLPKTEAVEKAYKYLDIHHRASDAEVAAAFRKRLLIDHPDKGGSKEAFCKLQACMALIRISRGEKL